MKRSIFLPSVALLAVCALSGTAQAALHDRGNGLIYDDALNVTWLQDANYAQTSGYDADGQMNWNEATTWAGNLVYGGYDNWRLPSITDTGTPGCNWGQKGTDCGWSVDTANSELAYMFHVNLGLISLYDENGDYDPLGGIFGDYNGLLKNILSGWYWSGTEYAVDTNYAWDFGTVGAQTYDIKSDQYYAWAVRDGDVTRNRPEIDTAPVPEPGTWMLLGAGLVGLVASRKKLMGSAA